jgi:hypothetical protein
MPEVAPVTTQTLPSMPAISQPAFLFVRTHVRV